MASITPSPQSSPSAVPPATSSTSSPPPSSISTPPPPPSSTSAPPPQSSPPPRSPATSSPISQPNVNPPETSNSTNSPPSRSPLPAVPTAPSPALPAFPPQQLTVGSQSQPPSSRTSPPTASKASPPPPNSAPPPSPNVPPPSSSKSSESPPPPRSQSSSPPPPPSPPVRSPPPTSSKPPESSPPPPSSKPPDSSPPPPSSKPPQNSPPPPSSEPPKSSPPPSTSKTPETSPPTPSSKPPNSSPPPPASFPPQSSSPPPPASIPPKSSPTPPVSTNPENSPPPSSLPPKSAPLPPRHTPSAPPSSHLTPPPRSSPPKSSPTLRVKPPPPPPTAQSPPPSGNQSSNDSITDMPRTSNSNNNGGIDTGALLAIAVATGIIVIAFLGLAVWCLRKRRKSVSRSGGHVMPSPPGYSQRSDSPVIKALSSAPLVGNGGGSESASSPTDPGGMGNSRSWFTFDELANATNSFSTQNLLGEGGFGSVYKGHLPDGREVAVKQLKIGGGQGEREFKAEVEIISRIHHRHLVSLVGYCISDNRRLLVYEYVPNNTLYHHLHGEGRPVLDWETRVKVAVGAARGIAYLHEDCHPRVFHRDIKSSNILLDENFEARVSDFGLAKLALDANSHVSTRVIGTFGYVAPEYASSGKLTEKSDVYSFGVVLLELITGRKPVDASQPLGDESLVEWARPLLSNALDNEEFEGLADPRLKKKYAESEMFRMIEVAAACVRYSAAKRPRMGQVVRAFDSLATSDLSNGMRVGQSEIYDSAQQSAEIRLFRRMAFGSQDYSTDFFSQVS